MTNIDRKYSRKAVTAWIFMALMGICALVWQLIAEHWSDDFYYTRFISGDDGALYGLSGSDPITSWSQAWDSIVNHYLYYNCRLANFLMLASNLLPSWLVDTLNALMIAAMLPLICLCAGGRKGMSSPVMATVGGALMWGVLPWWDNMVSVDYLFNYAWTSVMFLITAWLIIERQQELSSRGFAAVAVLAFLTAWMHEGFSLPFLGMMCVTWLRRPTRRGAWIVAALAAGSILNVFGPGTWNRMFNDMYGARSNGLLIYVRYMSRGVLALTPWLVVVVAALLGAWRASWRQVWLSIKGSWQWIAMALISYAMGVVLLKVGRTFWVMDLCVIIVGLRIAWQCVDLPHRITYPLAAAVGALCIAFMINLCYWQDYYGKEQREVIGEVQTTGVRALYLRHPMLDDAPWTTLGIVHRYNNWDPIAQYNLAMSLRTTYYDGFPTISEAHRGKAFNDMPRVEGDNHLRGEFPALYSDQSRFITIRLNLGAPLRSMHPADYAIYLLNGRPSESVLYNLEPVRVRDIDSTVIYTYSLVSLPRSAVHREVISIDTLETHPVILDAPR